MKKFFGILIALAMLTACASSMEPRQSKGGEPFFDAKIVDTFIPGKTTQQDIKKALGEPYPDPLKTPERWTYMYTYQRQIVFIFKDGVMIEKRWSEEYGISPGGK